MRSVFRRHLKPEILHIYSMSGGSGSLTMSVLLLTTLIFGMCVVTARDLKIGAFNIQVFGVTKAGKQDIMDILVQIVRRYDILLIQEIRDSSGKAIMKLLEQVNQDGVDQYLMALSERLGRTSSKEQYAYFYRKDDFLTLSDTYQYPDSSDKFEREPYSAYFTTPHLEFVLSGVHIKPDDAVAEINTLDSVHDVLKAKWGMDNILIMGDFNADCSYVGKSALSTLDLRKNSQYYWWIPDQADTTVSASDCAYDRFVMTGENFIASVLPNSVSVFDFGKEYGLTGKVTRDVSDHYPIDLTVRTGGASGNPTTTSGAATMSNFISYILKYVCFKRAI